MRMLAAPCFVISDAHLGAADFDAERKLVAFLRHLPGRAGSLLINGDLFDFWFEWKTVIPRGHFRTLAVSEASMRFHASARYDDLIRVETTLTRVTSRTLVFDYVVKNAGSGDRLATVSTTLISLDPDGRVTAMPAELRTKLSSVASDAA